MTNEYVETWLTAPTDEALSFKSRHRMMRLWSCLRNCGLA
jgi:hypothetical protein